MTATASQPAAPVGHAFEHGGDIARPGQRRALGWALGVNTALLVVEVIGGIVFGSLALLADAAHLVSDVAGLGIALGALILTARPVSTRHSFGFARAEVMAAQVSALLLLAAGVWILVEGVTRLGDPVPVQGAGLAAVATLGLVVNAGSAIVVHRAQAESLNMRASFVHLATDAAGSLGAVVAGLVIMGWGWARADSMVSIATAALVLWTGWGLLRESTHVLMEGTPRGLDPAGVSAAMAHVDGVVGVHHLHLWNLASDVPAASAHIVLSGQPTLREAQQTADVVRSALADRFALTNVTLELEDITSSAAARTVPSSRPGSSLTLTPAPTTDRTPTES
ncbi:MAG TPA: cation diffusion facilitator family transporter [Cellulomonas sp.]|uniref:cation diffusion facilitator family transporter n=1 Tax=Cellulomonas sp. TaxID=40001 RepID=UPI002E336C9D|nr:cation diffusion facilitator family transporter [Cellulomonas sp.]HEX5331248.1 cation diffusion facilitator family transporter [Cellulomonas sp.]